jgi:4-amino-4-deoxy-L-arabinose transferase-like glycosyltransferase
MGFGTLDRDGHSGYQVATQAQPRFFATPWGRILCLGLVGLASAATLTIHLWGIVRDLPFSPQVDEPLFVEAALTIAATGDLNPHWFGNPGSTVIYPLAAMYHLWAAGHGGSWFHPNIDLAATYMGNFTDFYLLGRLLTVLFTVASIPFVYLIGRRLFGTTVGIVAAWLVAGSPLVAAYAQLVRTDSAALFFTMVSLWLIIRAADRPTANRYLLAGAAIGLAVSTRYFMVALLPLLAFTRVARPQTALTPWRYVVLGTVAAATAFAVTTPYFFLDLTTALVNIVSEMRGNNPGTDGLSPAGNLAWYLTYALPWSLTAPQAALALLGIGLALYQRRHPSLILLGFAAVYLPLISLPALHWQRWLIQLLPVGALFAAVALQQIAECLERRHGGWSWRRHGAIALGTALLLFWPLVDVWRLKRLQLPSTRLTARAWIVNHLPPGSRLALEFYTAPLYRSLYHSDYLYTLAKYPSVDYFLQGGYHYLVLNDDLEVVFRHEPTRYAAEVAFYDSVRARATVRQRFAPTGRCPLIEDPVAACGSPFITIYELPGLSNSAAPP